MAREVFVFIAASLNSIGGSPSGLDGYRTVKATFCFASRQAVFGNYV
jgi:hypothetical protein